MYRRSAGQYAPQHAVNGAAHGLAAHRTGYVAGLHLRADVQQLGENAVCRGAKHPFAGIAADQTGNIGVGQGAAPIDHASQRVAAHGLHHGVAVLSGGEAGADAHDHRCVGHAGAQIALGQDRIHQRVGMQLMQTGQLRVGQHGHRAL